MSLTNANLFTIVRQVIETTPNGHATELSKSTLGQLLDLAEKKAAKPPAVSGTLLGDQCLSMMIEHGKRLHKFDAAGLANSTGPEKAMRGSRAALEETCRHLASGVKRVMPIPSARGETCEASKDGHRCRRKVGHMGNHVWFASGRGGVGMEKIMWANEPIAAEINDDF